MLTAFCVILPARENRKKICEDGILFVVILKYEHYVGSCVCYSHVICVKNDYI